MPVAAVAVVATLVAIRERRDETATRSWDVAGLLTLTVGLTATLVAIIEAPVWGWTAPASIATLAVGIGLLAAFCARELHARTPLVDLRLLRAPVYLAANLGSMTMRFCRWPLVFFVPLYLQVVAGYDALETGLLTVPLVAAVILVSPLVATLQQRLGSTPLVVVGLLLVVVSMTLLVLVRPEDAYAAILPALLAYGIGDALAYTTLSTIGLSAVPAAKTGVASGALSMTRYVAGALGVAIAGALFAHLAIERVGDDVRARGLALSGDELRRLDGLLSGSGDARAVARQFPADEVARIEAALREAFTVALTTTMWVVVAVALVGTLTTWVLLRRRAAPAEAGAVAGGG